MSETRGIHTLPVEGETNDWITPRDIIDALGPFDLDPCASVNQPWPCANRGYTYHDNGLRMPWVGRVWLNPPYGPHVGKWLSRLKEHGDGIAVVPARTETRWFASHVWAGASLLLFPAGRIKFCRPDGRQPGGNAGHSSVFVAYGVEAGVRLGTSDVRGVRVDEWAGSSLYVPDGLLREVL